ncbi:hypothetical protein [Photobacterium sp. 1_MG-2023]|uniref:hypothetical protein n=1 Tax=Photobacterium sp. 1_MG-2023 TaxID=3062646 RepID=UPI0026E3EE2B|nr:hypothetical protein [Photobacterium sp. 1_MG-2023]MDO6705878.1 hypothetical protein [Photobacterium sp. 1_MG-2023]
MKNIIAGVIALVIGFFALTFATVMGLTMALVALIAQPFLKRKLAKQYATFYAGNPEASSGQGRVIEGEYEPVQNHK